MSVFLLAISYVTLIIDQGRQLFKINVKCTFLHGIHENHRQKVLVDDNASKKDEKKISYKLFNEHSNIFSF